mmetsp:Transcript_45043/g.86124  ORF Transcript_45043/g.86124 Transcript_45043/m.86124 type:complete len:246 (+) Transcript_45043:1188-1925(+)
MPHPHSFRATRLGACRCSSSRRGQIPRSSWSSMPTGASLTYAKRSQSFNQTSRRLSHAASRRSSPLHPTRLSVRREAPRSSPRVRPSHWSRLSERRAGHARTSLSAAKTSSASLSQSLISTRSSAGHCRDTERSSSRCRSESEASAEECTSTDHNKLQACTETCVSMGQCRVSERRLRQPLQEKRRRRGSATRACVMVHSSKLRSSRATQKLSDSTEALFTPSHPVRFSEVSAGKCTPSIPRLGQ